MKRKLRLLLYTLLSLFLLVNAVAAMHAWRFTHFSDAAGAKTKDPAELSATDKIRTLVTGIRNPRPQNRHLPDRAFTTLRLQSNKEIECWEFRQDSSNGTILLFHGYSGEKSGLLGQARVFLDAGYNVLLVDFMGSGGSSGNQTTLGYKEAEEVKTCYDYAVSGAKGPVYLFGTSMGAVAILKALHDYRIAPAGIIIECPFGSIYETVCARFRSMQAPVFPMADLLVFWGGALNGFPANDLRPDIYAAAVQCPTLLLYGAADDKVSRGETDRIYNSLQGKKELKIYPLAGHENYLNKYQKEWTQDVCSFLKNN